MFDTRLNRLGNRALLALATAALAVASFATPYVAVAQPDDEPPADMPVELPDDARTPPPLVRTPALDRLAFAQEVLRLSNAERAKVGAAPLQLNDQLMKAAQDYAAVLAPGPCFEHTCPPEPDLGVRAKNAGYTGGRLGENIAAGDQTPADVVAGWMGSPGHRANILNPGYRELGVGVQTGSGEFGIYWVQVFGATQ